MDEWTFGCPMDISVCPMDEWIFECPMDISVRPMDEWTFECPMDISVRPMDEWTFIYVQWTCTFTMQGSCNDVIWLSLTPFG